MNKEYIFKYRYLGKFFWKKVKVIGHKWEPATDKMVVYFPDGSLYEIPHFKDMEVKLGQDWLLITKKQMEQESNQQVNLNV